MREEMEFAYTKYGGILCFRKSESEQAVQRHSVVSRADEGPGEYSDHPRPPLDPFRNQHSG